MRGPHPGTPGAPRVVPGNWSGSGRWACRSGGARPTPPAPWRPWDTRVRARRRRRRRAGPDRPRRPDRPLVRPELDVRGSATSYSVVVQPPGADRVFWHHTGANATYDGAGLDVSGLDLLHLGYPALLPALLTDGGAPLAALLGRARAAGGDHLGGPRRRRPAERRRPPRLAVPAATRVRGDGRAQPQPRRPHLRPRPADARRRRRGARARGRARRPAPRLGRRRRAAHCGDRGAVLRAAGAERLAAGGRALARSPRSGPVPRCTSRRSRSSGRPRPTEPATRPAPGCCTACRSGPVPRPRRGWPGRARPPSSRGSSPTRPRRGARPGPRRPARGAPPPAVPLPLPPNQPRARFYAGGRGLASFRGQGTWEPHTPEDWVGSVTTVRGEATTGLTRLPSGELLRDAVERDPVGWLGAAHAARWGSDPMLLVKLLDAGQRLPVHVHPDDAFAARHLGAAHGKARRGTSWNPAGARRPAPRGVAGGRWPAPSRSRTARACSTCCTRSPSPRGTACTCRPGPSTRRGGRPAGGGAAAGGPLDPVGVARVRPRRSRRRPPRARLRHGPDRGGPARAGRRRPGPAGRPGDARRGLAAGAEEFFRLGRWRWAARPDRSTSTSRRVSRCSSGSRATSSPPARGAARRWPGRHHPRPAARGGSASPAAGASSSPGPRAREPVRRGWRTCGPPGSSPPTTPSPRSTSASRSPAAVTTPGCCTRASPAGCRSTSCRPRARRRRRPRRGGCR